MIINIYLIRHAHVAYHTELGDKYRAGDYKNHLSPMGWEQSLELDFLLDKYAKENNIQFEQILSSDYARAVETITPFAIRTGLGIETTKFLRETIPETEAAAEVEKGYYSREAKFDYLGEGESRSADRLDLVIKNYVAEHKLENVLMVSHGGIMQSFLQKYLNFDIKLNWPDAVKISLENGKYLGFEKLTELVPFNVTGENLVYSYPSLEFDKTD